MDHAESLELRNQQLERMLREQEQDFLDVLGKMQANVIEAREIARRLDRSWHIVRPDWLNEEPTI